MVCNPAVKTVCGNTVVNNASQILSELVSKVDGGEWRILRGSATSADNGGLKILRKSANVAESAVLLTLKRHAKPPVNGEKPTPKKHMKSIEDGISAISIKSVLMSNGVSLVNALCLPLLPLNNGRIVLTIGMGFASTAVLNNLCSIH